jgi:NAD(P)-dependent dehydrogenase (short-subunit alcohol dehydrogenase family)
MKSLSRTKIILSVIFAFFLTPFPKRWGVYEFVSNVHPFFVGLTPLLIPSEEKWGFTFREFYGDGGYSDPVSKKQYRERLSGQTAIVTGANSGIGYEISLALARLGVSVTMACRNPSRCEAAANRIRGDEVVSRGDTQFSVTTMTVDTSSLGSVKKFCQEFQARSDGALDMLYLNAGIGMPAEMEDGSLSLSEDGIESVFATNVVGHHLMYKLLEQNIRRSERKTPARIMQTSSCFSFLSMYPYKVATDLDTLNGVAAFDGSLYAQSKLAQVLWSKELTARLDAEAKSNSSSDVIDPNSIVYANAAHPGFVNTNIWQDKVEEPNWRGKLFKSSARIIDSLMFTSEEGALTLLYLGTAVEKLQKDNIRGQYFHPHVKPMSHKLFAKDNEQKTKVLQEKLWDFLDELVADFL